MEAAESHSVIKDAIFQIWQEAFTDDIGYINLFINEGLPLGHPLFCGPAQTPSATLTLFPITFEQVGVSYPGFYLYALGTLLSERRKGYGKTLIKKAEQFAIETGRRFILLQPTPSPHSPLSLSTSLVSLSTSAPNHDLFAYYGKMGYGGLIYRSCMEYTRTALCALLDTNNDLTPLIMRSAPHEGTGDRYDRFVWPNQLRDYIRKECLFRGGSVISNAYCYPQIDANGSFLEIKEFQVNSELCTHVIPHILSVFPNMERFRFYGKALQFDKPFALVRFLDTDLEKRYDPRRAYFALGLD